MAVIALLSGCKAATPVETDRDTSGQQGEAQRWTITWEPIPDAVNYNVRVDVWENGGWKAVAYIFNTEGETEWTSNTHTGSFDRVRYRVRAVYADDSVGEYGPWVERTRE